MNTKLIVLSILLIISLFHVSKAQNPDTLDCSTDIGSTGLLLENGQCQCLFFHEWNCDELQCQPICNTDFATGIKEGSPFECDCREGSIWQADLRECVLDCSNDQFSTGQFESTYTCQCVNYASWNAITIKCELNCETIQNTDGTVNDQGTQCNCIQGFIWQDDQCLRDCASDQNSNGQRNDDSSCVCIQSAVWRPAVSQCTTIDCTKIQHSLFNAINDGTTCQCQTGFTWSEQFGQCIKVCENAEGYNIAQNFNYHACKCSEGGYWNEIGLQCYIDCSTKQKSTGNNQDQSTCECQTGYQWQQQGDAFICKTVCGNSIGQIASYDSENRRCECDAANNFIYIIQKNRCQLDCSMYQFVDDTYGQDADQCICFKGYTWSKENIQCILDCDGPFDTGAIAEGKCVCQVNSIWNSPSRHCLPQCGKDKRSTGIFNTDRCECRMNANWIESQNICQCAEGYYFDQKPNGASTCKKNGGTNVGAAAAGVAGGAVLAGSSVFMGMYLRNRKKKKEQEDVVEYAPESQKDFQNQVVSIGGGSQNKDSYIPPRQNIL